MRRRLAVSEARQGERLDAMLLADAVRRAYASAATVGSSASAPLPSMRETASCGCRTPSGWSYRCTQSSNWWSHDRRSTYIA